MSPKPRALGEWLAHCERLHPKTIDMTLDRVAVIRDRLGLKFDAPLIAVAGTNGKGSTCAMLEAIVLQAGYRVGMYTSPHLVRFEERCRIGGEPVDPALLLPQFEAVEGARGEIVPTYFEFTTLAILRTLAAAELDLVILEVGLGGRLDAVNAVDSDVAVITSIDLDHMEYLGPDRESIGLEKAHIMRPHKPAIVSDPVPPRSVVEYGERIGADLWLVGRDFAHQGDRQQWSWAGRGRRIAALGYPALRGANQLVNVAGVLAALEALRGRLPVPVQAVRNGLALVDWPGRFQIVPGQPALVLDVAHNPHAVAALALNLDQMGFFPRTHAVFGAMRDKDIAGIVRRMVPLVDHWHCCALDTPRAAGAEELAAAVLSAAAASPGSPAGLTVATHADPAAALRAALEAADPADRIVVFGSFYTVGGVLRAGLPRLKATHV